MIYTSSPLHQVVKINLFHFRINSLTFLWCRIWKPGGMHRAEVLGVCVDSLPYVIIHSRCHLLTWPLFCWYLIYFIYRLLLPYCMISSLLSGPVLLAASITLIPCWVARHKESLRPLLWCQFQMFEIILLFLCLEKSEVAEGSNQLHMDLF